MCSEEKAIEIMHFDIPAIFILAKDNSNDFEAELVVDIEVDDISKKMDISLFQNFFNLASEFIFKDIAVKVNYVNVGEFSFLRFFIQDKVYKSQIDKLKEFYVENKKTIEELIELTFIVSFYKEYIVTNFCEIVRDGICNFEDFKDIVKCENDFLKHKYKESVIYLCDELIKKSDNKESLERVFKENVLIDSNQENDPTAKSD